MNDYKTLAAQARERAEIHRKTPFPSAGDRLTAELLDRLAAALESPTPPERVQGETTVQSVIDDLVRRYCKPVEEEVHEFDRGFEAGRIDDAVKIATRLAGLYKQIEDLTRDRDEWKQQHENLLFVRQQDLAALTAPTPPTAPAQASEGAEPGWTQEEIEEVIACLGDDAAQLRDSNPEDERADNMDRAACMVQVFSDALRASSPAEPREPLTDEQIDEAWDQFWAGGPPLTSIAARRGWARHIEVIVTKESRT